LKGANSLPFSIETERLLLRPPCLGDFEDWAAMAADEELTRYIGGPLPAPLAWRAMAAQAGSWSLLGYGLFSVVEKASGRWAGCVGPVRPPGWPVHEIGWRLARWAHGRGFANEAASAAIIWAIRELRWDDIVHPIHPDNLASIRVAERLGARKGGPLAMPPPFDALPSSAWSYDREGLDRWRRLAERNAES
jgi:RimJ/RimL family protein N-acetyltransferase